MAYRTILADPPWPLRMSGKYKSSKNKRPEKIPYRTMTVDAICRLNVSVMAEPDCHLWLWTTNAFIEDGFEVMRAWGFKYLAPIHWIKPSGIGNYFVHRTQTMLFGYREKCRFPLRRYAPNILQDRIDPKRHSQKPESSFRLIEEVSPGPRLELFARERRVGWDAWGDEVPSSVPLFEINA